MTDEHEQTSELVRRAAAGETMARDELFTRYRQRLKRMVRLRLNRHLQGRVDESDIVQESALDAARHFDDYLRDPSMPFYLWLRCNGGAGEDR